MHIVLSEISVYPIKACGAVSQTRWELEPRGLRLDRRWMVVDTAGVFMTQRDYPRLTLVSVRLHTEHLTLNAPGMEPLDVPLAPPGGRHLPVVIWDDGVEAADAGEDAAGWFSEYLETACRLVGMTDRSVRPVNPEYAVNHDVVSFADGYPLLLISEASLADLNSRLESPISMKRFRPNLVVKGCEPFAEDTWKEIAIGDVHFHLVKPCARCTVPTVDLATGEKGVEPLRTLKTFRNVGNQVMFGQNLIHAANGTLAMGDEVRIVRWK